MGLWVARESQEDRDKRRRLWRERQAGDAEKGGRWFAAAFHLGRLIDETPADAALYARRCNAEIRLGPWTQVKTRVVTRTIKVKGKKKKVRRVIRSTVKLGSLGSVGVTGSTTAAAEVRLSNPPGNSSLTWDPTACVAVDVTG